MNAKVAKAITMKSPSARRTTAQSVTTPTSNTRRKIVPVKLSQKAEPVKEKHVALLPVRYAVAKRGNDGKTYRYTAPKLKYDLPLVGKASYVLRSLRRGFIYVYVDGKLACLKVSAGGYLGDSGHNPQDVELRIEGGALLLPSRYGTAELAFSEHEWTGQQCQQVISNTDNARTSLMQSFSLANPAKGAFPLADLGNEVEEYAGRTNEYTWCDEKATARKAEQYVRLKTLAEDGQHVVALADPIGITHDLAALIELRLGEIKKFVSDPDAPPENSNGQDAKTAGGKTKQTAPQLTKPDAATSASHDAARARYRKKLVAEAIGRLYESHLKPGVDPDTLARLRLEYWQKDPVLKHRTPPTLAELRRDVITTPSVTPGSERLLKHVKEKERRAFLTDYDKQLKALQKTLDACRTDRVVWLKTWNKSNDPHALHSAWQSFDMDDRNDWQLFELSYARSIAGLGMSGSEAPADDGSPTGVQADELSLVDAWLHAPFDDSPMSLALAGHTPLREKAKTLADKAAATQNAPSQQKKKTGPSALYKHAADRTGASVDGVRSIIAEIYKLFPHTIGTEEITRALSIYLLTKPTSWKGASLNSVEQWISKCVGNEGGKNASMLVDALEGRYGKHVEMDKLPKKKVVQFFSEAEGGTPTVSKTMSAMRFGSLSEEGLSLFTVEDVTVNRHVVFSKAGANPFLAKGTAGFSIFVGLFYMVNLNRAVEAFDINERGESTVNLASAVAAIGSGVNAGLIAFKDTTPKAIGSLYMKVPILKGLGGGFALRLFGYGGAILTGATLGIHGFKLAQKGDYDAGLLYAGSAITAAAGGSALTYVSGALLAEAAPLLLSPIGWFIVGTVLVVGSMYLSIAGDEDTDTPVETWLDACTFGNQELPDSKPFAAFADEMDALGVAMYAPQKIGEADWESRWGFEHYLATTKVFLPAYILGKSHLAIRANGTSVAPVKDLFENGGRVIELQEYIKKDLGIKKCTFEVEYRPSDAFAKPFTLTINVTP